MKSKLNYLDLFSGIGGFSEGIKQSGVEFAWHGFSEIDKYAATVYKAHFPEAVELGSVTGITTASTPSTRGTIPGIDIPKLDLITFGFPCQDLSIAGKRKGLDGKRSGLFFEAIRIINETRPRYFVFENVKGLFSSAGGRDFVGVLRAIADIGYDGQWQLLNTSWFLPQNRERVYFVGHSPADGTSRPQVFPIGEGGIGTSEIQREAGTGGAGFRAEFTKGNEIKKALKVGGMGVNDLVDVSQTDRQ